MYAVIKSGGKQYRVSEGQTLRLEKLPIEAGDTVTFEQVLLLAGDGECQVGKPFVTGASVTATVIKQARDKKIRIIKFRRRKHHMKRQGHRQYYTEVKIGAIAMGQSEAAAASSKPTQQHEGQ